MVRPGWRRPLLEHCHKESKVRLAASKLCVPVQEAVVLLAHGPVSHRNALAVLRSQQQGVGLWQSICVTQPY